jgi:hypothetical protein
MSHILYTFRASTLSLYYNVPPYFYVYSLCDPNILEETEERGAVCQSSLQSGLGGCTVSTESEMQVS